MDGHPAADYESAFTIKPLPTTPIHNRRQIDNLRHGPAQ
jgi:hypothetical protein